MSNKATRVTEEEQFLIIQECRSSGMSDHQWCIEHGIKPGTFYNWVKRLKRKPCYDVPAAYGRGMKTKPQDVVPLFVRDDAEVNTKCYPSVSDTYAIEISQGQSIIRISNSVDSELLKCILRNL